jgi:hypothetical protein
MNKFICGFIAVSILFAQTSYYGSTTAPVVIVGGIIKAKHQTENTTKYKRKDCPVCKGKGWYMSGDNIKKIDCTYCELEQSKVPNSAIQVPNPTSNQNCPDGKCPITINKKK